MFVTPWRLLETLLGDLSYVRIWGHQSSASSWLLKMVITTGSSCVFLCIRVVQIEYHDVARCIEGGHYYQTAAKEPNLSEDGPVPEKSPRFDHCARISAGECLHHHVLG